MWLGAAAWLSPERPRKGDHWSRAPESSHLSDACPSAESYLAAGPIPIDIR
jgi:hypothetical protein